MKYQHAITFTVVLKFASELSQAGFVSYQKSSEPGAALQ